MIFKVLTVLLSISVFINDVVASQPVTVTIEKRPKFVGEELVKILYRKSDTYLGRNGEHPEDQREENLLRIDVCNFNNKAVYSLCKALIENIDETIDTNKEYGPEAHKCETREILIPMAYSFISALLDYKYENYGPTKMARCPPTTNGKQYMITEGVTNATGLLLRSPVTTDLVYSSSSDLPKVVPWLMFTIPDPEDRCHLHTRCLGDPAPEQPVAAGAPAQQPEKSQTEVEVKEKIRVIDQIKEELETVESNMYMLQVKKARLLTELKYYTSKYRNVFPELLNLSFDF